MSMSIFTVDVKGEVTVYVNVGGFIEGGVITKNDTLGGYNVDVIDDGRYFVDTIIEAKMVLVNCARDKWDEWYSEEVEYRYVGDDEAPDVDDEESEDNEEPDTYTVALMTDYGFTESCHPLAVGVDHATARSIYRHFYKECEYNYGNCTGQYVTMVSRKWCINHADFEHETRFDDYEELEVF